MTQRRKLLLADDSVVIQKVVSLTFEDEGFEVVAFGNGEQAVRQLEDDDFPPDIVLADIFMPAPNGYEVCARVKNDPRLRHIPVLLMVGTFEPYNETEARRVGADGLVTKPFQSIKDLVNKVGSLLGGGSNREDDADTKDLHAPPAAERSSSSAAASTADADAGARMQQINSNATSPLPWDEPRITETGGSESEAARGAQEEIPVAASAAEISFADLGMDDRMIEERPAAQPDAVQSDAAQSDADVHSLFVLRPDVTKEEEAETDMPRDEERRDETHNAIAADEAPNRAHAPQYASHDRMQSPFADAGNEPSRERDEEVTLVNEPSPFFAQASRAEDSLLDLDNGEPLPHALAEADDFILDLADDAPDTSPATPTRWDTSPANASATTATHAGSSRFDASYASSSSEQRAESVSDAPGSAIDTESAFAEAAHGEASGIASGIAPDDEMPTMIASPTADDGEASSQRAEGSDRGYAESFAPRHVLEKSGTITPSRVPDLESRSMTSFAEAAGLVPDKNSRDTNAGFVVYGEPDTGMSVGEQPPRVESGRQASAAGGGQVTLEQLSPEVIDAIARRVVEHLSERVIREIAWEVVPDLSELLIKQRLDEERKQ